MRIPNHRRQRGYVLILTVLMLMGLGGVVLANFTNEARRDLEAQKFQHNKRVLAEAKQALLMFAYNYPQSNPGIGPGRLPCPDVDNNGTVDGAGTCAQVGRFPYADWRIEVPRLLDASGETLWYALSSAFDNIGGGGVINSDTNGTITLVDSSGQILYDGAVEGIAAVVIAPGPPLRRDNDGDGVYGTTQVRLTTGVGGDRRNPQNYLDTFTLVGGVTSYDNSVFLNGSSANDSDGFILGPVYDPQLGDIVVNDQMIIITAEEVIQMAEKAVAETYRDAIIDYQETLWPGLPGSYRYPWLSAYGDTSDLDIYNPQPGRTFGRVPFLEYYVDNNSPHWMTVADLQIDFDITLNFTAISDTADPFDQTYLNAFSAVFNALPAVTQVNVSNAELSFSRTSFNGAADITTDNIGTMIVRDQIGGTSDTTISWPTSAANPGHVRLYFWDGTGAPLPTDGWQLCPVVLGDGRDCAKDNDPPYNFENYSDWADHADIQVRMVEIQYVDPDFVLELDYLPLPGIAVPTLLPGAANHARFDATFANAQVPTLPVADPAEPDTRNFLDFKVTMCDQDTFVGNGLELVSLSNANAGTIDCTDPADTPNPINPSMTFTVTLNNNVVITSDWHPQLPSWISANGWDDAVMLSYMPDFAPAGDGACTPDGDAAVFAADDCLFLSNFSGSNNDIQALLVLAGEHDLADGNDFNSDGDQGDANEAPDSNFADELHDIFESENYSGIGLYPGPSLYPAPNNDPTPASDTGQARVFDKREQLLPGNVPDTVFVIN